MPRNSLGPRTDHPRASTVIMFAALAAAAGSLLVTSGFNGLSLVAVILVLAALAARLAEGAHR